MKIHFTSVVSPEVEIGPDVEIGPYCFIQGKGKIGRGTYVEGHVTLGFRHGIIVIGENNHFSPGAVIGGPPQDVSYRNEETSLIIGNNNVFREFSTVNLATAKGDKKTEIANDCYLMAYTHIAHDCKIGSNVIVANNTHFGGHCEVEDNVVIGGGVCNQSIHPHRSRRFCCRKFGGQQRHTSVHPSTGKLRGCASNQQNRSDPKRFF